MKIQENYLKSNYSIHYKPVKWDNQQHDTKSCQSGDSEGVVEEEQGNTKLDWT